MIMQCQLCIQTCWFIHMQYIQYITTYTLTYPANLDLLALIAASFERNHFYVTALGSKRYFRDYNKMVPSCTLSRHTIDYNCIRVASAWSPSMGEPPSNTFHPIRGIIVGLC